MAFQRKLIGKIYEIKAHAVKVTSLDLGETGRVLVTGGQDRNVNLWAIGEEKCFMSLTGHNGGIDCVKFAYNDDFVYSADDIGIIRRWDLNAQTSSTLNGHMKSVRTLDFNPSGSSEYVVSGSNDTTVRLWDIRSQNRCIKTYRGHIANVNSVKFSPDGLWIASAGTEGSIIIWDIRKSKQIMQFTERASPITCIQFHPYEFLLAAGRNDGSVYIYDLEKNELISKHENTNPYTGQTVKCTTFSETGECLFVGTAGGVSVIGWEPNREFDHVESNWSFLGDMKIVNRRLILGSYERENVAVHSLNIERMFPFYNPSTNTARTTEHFNQNSTTRRSFSKTNQKLRLSLNKKSQIDRLQEEDIENTSPSIDGGGSSNGGNSSPNLSLELVDIEEPVDQQDPASFESFSKKFQSTGFTYPSLSSNSSRSSGTANIDFGSSPGSISLNTLNSYSDGPSSLKIPGERDTVRFDKVASVYENNLPFNTNMHLHRPDDLSSELAGVKINISANGSYSLNDSQPPPIISNYDEAEMEDFVVNCAQLPDYAPGQVNFNPPPPSSIATKPVVIQKSKAIPVRKISSSHLSSNTRQNGLYHSASTTSIGRKLGNMQSVSTMELHKMDENMIINTSKVQRTINRTKRLPFEGTHASQNQQNNNGLHQNKENNSNRNSKAIPVHILTKPPARSRTSLDLRPSSSVMNLHNHSSKVSNFNTDDTNDIHMLMQYHNKIYYELNNRYATLQSIRDSTREKDVVGALKKAIKISGRTVFVDLLGAILEKTSTWNLDLCLLLLPEIYELLQSQHKFHHTRACDTLRVILKNFLPIIEENCGPWAAGSTIGVDLMREERQRKCLECHNWLMRIRNLPSDTQHIGSSLAQLQNMITN